MKRMDRIVTKMVAVARSGLGLPILGALLASLAGCGAVFPEVATPLRVVPPNREITPPPPPDLIYIEVAGAHIPSKTRDGRSWGEGEGAAPDPFAIVFVGENELYRTPVESGSLSPTWELQPSGNYKIPVGTDLQVELLDSNSMSNQSICLKTVGDLHEEVAAGESQLDLLCEGGARIMLTIGPARPRLGLGLFYEVVLGNINVTRLHSYSPAARAGVKAGDSILEIMGKKVENLEDGEAQSLINANAQLGVDLLIKHENGQVKKIKLKEGAVYPLRKEFDRQQAVSE
jgi:hypothetical protein